MFFHVLKMLYKLLLLFHRLKSETFFVLPCPLYMLVNFSWKDPHQACCRSWKRNVLL
ncbi:hypothetical protein KP509_1Z299600 [Ceratopteris richardii]|nr:hypothetical protein KP509_1Z299600 [Ceratopteris richardii]